MKTRRRVLILAAFAVALVSPSVSPAHAGGCVPTCSFGGTVVGSIIVPGDLFNFKGTFQANSTNPGAHFDIENGTLKINGKSAGNFKEAIVVRQFTNGFQITNAPGTSERVSAFFGPSGGSYKSDNVAVGGSGGSDSGGGLYGT